MIEWHCVKDKLPPDNTECVLYNDEAGHVIGPIFWKATGDSGMWIDLFGPYASREAGIGIRPEDENGPTHWAEWNAPSDESHS